MAASGAIRHPLNPKALYTPDGPDTVLVTMGSRWGRFRRDGTHVEGSVFEADPELCLWVSAPRPDEHHRLSRVIDMSGER